MSHAGTALLAEVADKIGLTRALSTRLADLKQRRRGHDPGRVIRDLAVMLADGGECVSDLGAVREQDALFGAVASDSTAFRMVDRIASTPGMLDALRSAHAQARARFWELSGRAGAVDDRRRRDADHRALGEGAGGRQLQARVRVSSAGRLRRRDPRGAGDAVAPGERRLEHRRRSHDGDRPGARADPRRARRDDRDPGPGRFGRRDARDRRSLPARPTCGSPSATS